MQISIQKKENVFNVQEGKRTAELMQNILKKNTSISLDELENVKNEAAKVLSCCLDPQKDITQNTTSLAVGYVQSGKTLSFTILSALASDNGFKTIIYFAGTKNNLLRQTSERLAEDLIEDCSDRLWYKPIENPKKSDIDLICKSLRSPSMTLLITVLKHHVQLRNLAEIFEDNDVKRFLKKNGVLIIDDEADQASLNGLAYKNSKAEDWEEEEFTSTYASILRLRTALPNHSYVQYTATPQGPLLISIMDLLSPRSHTVLTPGSGYTGGKVFFKERPGLILTIPEEEVYHSKHRDLVECPSSLISALQVYLISVAIVVRINKTEKFLSMMVHADKEQDASRKFSKWISNQITEWTNILECSENDVAYQEMKKSFEISYEEAIREYVRMNEPVPSFQEIFSELRNVMDGTESKLVISSNKDNSIKWNAAISYILIGADMLNRGFTVKNLAVTYMPRYSIGKSNADTIQQRCRFFGYKQKYLNSCRVYLPWSSQLEYREYVEDEEEMRTWLQNSKDLENVARQLVVSGQMNPTRKNILSKDIVTTKLSGWRQTNAVFTIDENKKFIEVFIKQNKNKFIDYPDQYGTDDRDHRYLKLSIVDVVDFLTNFKFRNTADSLRKQATIRYLNYLTSQKECPVQFAYVIEMAYKSEEPRVRAFDCAAKKINNLHSGRSTKGKSAYPGDADIKFNDSICIQIHHVRLKSEDAEWHGKDLYTLAIYYPEQFASKYIGN